MNTHFKIALLLFVVFISLNSCETCLYDSCPDDPLVTEISDLEFSPLKETYARTDTIRIKVIHSKQGDSNIEFVWALYKPIKIHDDIMPSDSTREGYYYNTNLEEIVIVPRFTEPTRTPITVRARREGYMGVSYTEFINVN